MCIQGRCGKAPATTSAGGNRMDGGGRDLPPGAGGAPREANAALTKESRKHGFMGALASKIAGFAMRLAIILYMVGLPGLSMAEESFDKFIYDKEYGNKPVPMHQHPLKTQWDRLKSDPGEYDLNGRNLSAYLDADGNVVIPDLTSPVMDMAGVLKDSEKSSLVTKILTLENNVGAQIFVFIVPSEGRETIDNLGLRVARTWKPGQAGKNNGAMITIAMKERHINIQLGTGLAKFISNSDASRIIQENYVPYAKNGMFAKAINSAVDGLAVMILNEEVNNGTITKYDMERMSKGMTPTGPGRMAKFSDDGDTITSILKNVRINDLGFMGTIFWYVLSMVFFLPMMSYWCLLIYRSRVRRPPESRSFRTILLVIIGYVFVLFMPWLPGTGVARTIPYLLAYTGLLFLPVYVHRKLVKFGIYVLSVGAALLFALLITMILSGGSDDSDTSGWGGGGGGSFGGDGASGSW